MRDESSRECETEPSEIDWSQELVQHAPWLRRVICARLGEQAGVDEVFQELAVAALRQKAPVRDPLRVAPWLYRLAVNLSLLHRRKLGRRRKLMDRYATQVVVSQEPPYEEPCHWLLREERRQMVRDAMGELSSRDSEILVLRHTQDWSYRQIAEHLGITESAVETRLHRARRRLAAMISRREREPNEGTPEQDTPPGYATRDGDVTGA